jgi:hypothetical protein
MWGERNALYAGPPPWLSEPIVLDTMSAAEIQQLRDGFLAAPATTLQRAVADPDRLLRNVAALHKAGVKPDLGTDTGGVTGGGAFRSGVPRRARADPSRAGLTPMQAIVPARARQRRSWHSISSARSRRAIGRLLVLDANSARRHRQHSADFDGLPAGCRSQRAPIEEIARLEAAMRDSPRISSGRLSASNTARFSRCGASSSDRVPPAGGKQHATADVARQQNRDAGDGHGIERRHAEERAAKGLRGADCQRQSCDNAGATGGSPIEKTQRITSIGNAPSAIRNPISGSGTQPSS